MNVPQKTMPMGRVLYGCSASDIEFSIGSSSNKNAGNGTRSMDRGIQHHPWGIDYYYREVDAARDRLLLKCNLWMRIERQDSGRIGRNGMPRPKAARRFLQSGKPNPKPSGGSQLLI